MTQLATALIVVAWVIAAAIIRVGGGHNAAQGWVTIALVATFLGGVIIVACADHDVNDAYHRGWHDGRKEREDADA